MSCRPRIQSSASPCYVVDDDSDFEEISSEYEEDSSPSTHNNDKDKRTRSKRARHKNNNNNTHDNSSPCNNNNNDKHTRTKRARHNHDYSNSSSSSNNNNNNTHDNSSPVCNNNNDNSNANPFANPFVKTTKRAPKNNVRCVTPELEVATPNAYNDTVYNSNNILEHENDPSSLTGHVLGRRWSLQSAITQVESVGALPLTRLKCPQASLKIIALSSSNSISTEDVEFWKQRATVETFHSTELENLEIRRETVVGELCEGVHLNMDVAQINSKLYGVGCGILESLFAVGDSTHNEMKNTILQTTSTKYLKTVSYHHFLHDSDTFLKTMSLELETKGLVLGKLQFYHKKDSATTDHGDGRANWNVLMVKIGGWFGMKLSHSKKEKYFLALQDGNSLVVNPDDVSFAATSENRILHAGGGPCAITILVHTHDGRQSTMEDQLNLCTVLFKLNQKREQEGLQCDSDSFQGYFGVINKARFPEWQIHETSKGIGQDFFMENINVLRMCLSKQPDFDVNHCNSENPTLKSILFDEDTRERHLRWITRVRNEARHNRLPDWKLAILDEVGIISDSMRDPRFSPYFQAIRTYLKENPDVKADDLCKKTFTLPHPVDKNQELKVGKDLQDKKSLLKKGKLGEEWKKALADFGFSWATDPSNINNMRDPRFSPLFQAIQTYLKENPDVKVDNLCKRSFTLPDLKVGRVLQDMKSRLKNGKLGEEWKKALADFGFSWATDLSNINNMRDPRFSPLFQAIQTYLKENPDVKVDNLCKKKFTLPDPEDKKQELKVGQVLQNMKSRLKNGKLGEEWKKALADFGFSWATDLSNINSMKHHVSLSKIDYNSKASLASPPPPFKKLNQTMDNAAPPPRQSTAKADYTSESYLTNDDQFPPSATTKPSATKKPPPKSESESDDDVSSSLKRKLVVSPPTKSVSYISRQKAPLRPSPRHLDSDDMELDKKPAAVRQRPIKDHPQIVQDLVQLNGLGLDQALDAYKVAGDNLEELCVFLMTNTSDNIDAPPPGQSTAKPAALKPPPPGQSTAKPAALKPPPPGNLEPFVPSLSTQMTSTSKPVVYNLDDSSEDLDDSSEDKEFVFLTKPRSLKAAPPASPSKKTTNNGDHKENPSSSHITEVMPPKPTIKEARGTASVGGPLTHSVGRPLIQTFLGSRPPTDCSRPTTVPKKKSSKKSRKGPSVNLHKFFPKKSD